MFSLRGDDKIPTARVPLIGYFWWAGQQNIKSSLRVWSQAGVPLAKGVSGVFAHEPRYPPTCDAAQALTSGAGWRERRGPNECTQLQEGGLLGII